VKISDTVDESTHVGFKPTTSYHFELLHTLILANKTVLHYY